MRTYHVWIPSLHINTPLHELENPISENILLHLQIGKQWSLETFCFVYNPATSWLRRPNLASVARCRLSVGDTSQSAHPPPPFYPHNTFSSDGTDPAATTGLFSWARRRRLVLLLSILSTLLSVLSRWRLQKLDYQWSPCPSSRLHPSPWSERNAMAHAVSFPLHCLCLLAIICSLCHEIILH